MIIDTRDINDLGPAKFRTGADDNEKVCYYNRDKIDKVFNCFLALTKQTTTNKIIFSIVNLIDKSNKKEDIYFEINDELREFKFEPGVGRASENNANRETVNNQWQQQQQQQWQQQKRPQRYDRWISQKPQFLSE